MSDEEKVYAPVTRDERGRITGGANRTKKSKSGKALQMSRQVVAMMRRRYGPEGELQVYEWACDVGENKESKGGDRVRASEFLANRMWGGAASFSEMMLARAAAAKSATDATANAPAAQPDQLANFLRAYDVLARVGVIPGPGGFAQGALPAPGAPVRGSGSTGADDEAEE